MDRVILLLPAYNEEPRIPNTIRMVKTAIENIKNYSFTILVVDDGSVDNTAPVSEKEGAVVLRHPENMGKGMAHRTAFKYAGEKGYDLIIALDADGQHDPAEIPLFLMASRKYPLVIGKRNANIRNMPLIRYFTNYITSMVTSLLAGKKVRDSQSGYRLFRREVFTRFKLKTTRFQTESEEIIQAGRMGFPIGEVPIKTIYRDSGRKSYIHPVIDTLRFIKMVWDCIWL